MIVRRDLPLGLLVAQVIHAAGESSPGGLDSGTYAVALSVPGEKELESLRARLVSDGVGHRAIYEPMEPWNGTLMAIGLTPCPKEDVKRYTSQLSLLR